MGKFQRILALFVASNVHEKNLFLYMAEQGFTEPMREEHICESLSLGG